jgi:hypothetical protein
MIDIKVYDKVSWHIDNSDESEISYIENYFLQLMNFLFESNLLSDYGQEIFSLGVDSSLSITSGMLNATGNKLFDDYYDAYLTTVRFGNTYDFTFLKSKLRIIL